MKRNKLIIIAVLSVFIVTLIVVQFTRKQDTSNNTPIIQNILDFDSFNLASLRPIKVEVEAEDRTEELKELQKLLNDTNSKIYSESTKIHENSELYTIDNVEYKSGASETYETLGTLEKGTKVQTTGITQNDWYQCNIDGQIVYIHTDNLEEKKIEITATGTKAEYQKYAYSLFKDYGWSDDEFDPLVRLWTRESNWSPSAHNPSSGAHGIPQSLPASKMASEGEDYYTNGYTQIRWGLKYIKNRYGTPSNAWAHSEATGWY